MIKVILDDLTLNITDGKHGDCPDQKESGYYFISCKDVYDGAIHYKNARQITKESFEEADKRTMLAPDDILVTNSGTIGRMAFIKQVPVTRRTTFQKSVAIIKPNTDKIIPAYLYYRLQDCISEFVNQSNGSAQKNLLLSTMRAFTFNIHEEKKVQERIANILANYDTLIENNQKQILLLEEAAQRLYKEWFVDLRFPSHEKIPIINGLPKGWQKLTLEAVTPICTGKKDANFSVKNGEYPFFTCAQQPIKAPSYSFDCEAVILAGNGDFNVKLYRGKFEAYQRTYVFSPNNLKYLYLLYYAVQNSITQLLQGASGSTIKFLTKSMLENISVISPNEETLVLFNTCCESYQQRIENLNNQIVYLKEIRNRLLPKLMSGILKV